MINPYFVFLNENLTVDRPIMALVGGLEAPRGRVMGHAGAWAAPGEAEGRAKVKALEDAGAVLVNHPEKFGEGMKTLLSNTARRPVTTVSYERKCSSIRGD
jgi:succinyl-CoA synthetase alpha subunit